MRWNKFTIQTRTELEDILIAVLADIGIESVEIEEGQPQFDADIEGMPSDVSKDCQDSRQISLCFYLDEKEDKDAVLDRIRAELHTMSDFLDFGSCTITESQTEEKDWINNWKKYFKRFYVDDILIVPSWEPVNTEHQEKMIIRIDPGTTFGTGHHETTQLCIHQLKKYVTADTRLLDVGTGSGILGIVALKMGADHVVGTDLDPGSVAAVAENLQVNQVSSEDFDLMIGNIIDDIQVQQEAGYEQFDIVVANILTDVLVPLTPVIWHQMKPGALYITSGIIDWKEELILEVVKTAGFELVEVTRQGEWVSITTRKPV